MIIRQLLEVLDSIAPFSSAEEWDNVGLLIGDPAMEVRGIHIALDATSSVLSAMGSANVLLTHHPVMFAPVRRFDALRPETTVIAECLRRGIALISLHTNWDKAPGGVSDALADALGLQTVEAPTEYLRVGMLPEAMLPTDIVGMVKERLGRDNIPARFPGQDALIRRIAVAPGAGGDQYEEAVKSDAQAFITGEIKHHQLLDCYALGMAVLECGHFETEQPSIPALAGSLQKRLDGLQYTLEICVSEGFSGAL